MIPVSAGDAWLRAVLRHLGFSPGYPEIGHCDGGFFRSDLLAGSKDRSQDHARTNNLLSQKSAVPMFITEIFKSIQGEGTRAGLPCIFVRLTGCNLRCTWCDTAYAFHGGKKMSVPEVAARVDELARRNTATSQPAIVPLVELTGGEPLLQEEIYPLAEQLLAAGYTVMIETSGERYIGRLPQRSDQNRGREMSGLRRGGYVRDAQSGSAERK